MYTPGNIYKDQTGRFPLTSSKGTKYVFVLYYYDNDKIFTKPLKERTGKQFLRTKDNLIMNWTTVISNQKHIG